VFRFAYAANKKWTDFNARRLRILVRLGPLHEDENLQSELINNPDQDLSGGFNPQPLKTMSG